MKKFLILIVSLFIMVPISVKAEGIPNYFVNATVEKNGDITVEEYFYLNGSFNGMERIIEYRNKDAYSFDSTSNYYGGSTIHNGDGVSIKSVKALAINPNFDFNSISGDNFKKVSSADPGDYGVYTVEEDMDGETVRIFLPDKKNKAFYIKYVLNNMAISHNDVGEIGWNIIGDSFRENVGHFRGIVNFPYNDIDLRAWAHGPLNGNVSILSNEKLQVTIDNLSSYTPIDVRATFSNKVIENSNKKTFVVALDKILNYEEDEAAKANYEREQVQKNVEKDALKAIEDLEEFQNKYFYNRALEKTSLIINEKLRTEYIARIKLQEETVRLNEIESARIEVNYARSFLTYKAYNDAYKEVLELDDKDAQDELMQELEKLVPLIKNKEKTNGYTNSVVCLILIFIMVVTYTVYYNLKLKEEKPTVKIEYLRQLPSDISPASLGFLIRKKITKKELNATILDFIDRGIVTYKKVGFRNYKLTLAKEDSNLSDADSKFIKFLFCSRKSVTTKDFRSSSYQIDNSLNSKYNTWKNAVVSEVESKNLIEKQSEMDKSTGIPIVLVLMMIFGSLIIPIIGFLVLIGGIIYLIVSKKIPFRIKAIVVDIIFMIIALGMFIYILVVNHYNYYSLIFNFLVFVIAIVEMYLFGKSRRKRTKEGVEELSKWKALKRFLTSFSTFEEKELPELRLWNRYLVYATILGCAGKLAKVMALKAGNYAEFNMLLAQDYNSFHDFSSNVSHSVSTHYATYSSSGSYSSGSGGGGGFSGGSSGGGSFGGGGGGGRF